ncbi:hypothetical protein [Phaeacidiphilus oryzae]|uniref:hypothetical protein n=1 Tax=Phaeacidiphilus oryzae TaxID=348818 RepID=UPI00126A6833|nr:hypothetical protein [Phaeacidiphilus oryzae]
MRVDTDQLWHVLDEGNGQSLCGRTLSSSLVAVEPPAELDCRTDDDRYCLSCFSALAEAMRAGSSV